MKDAEAIEAVDGFGNDEWIDGIFGHSPWSLIPRGSTGISLLLRHTAETRSRSGGRSRE